MAKSESGVLCPCGSGKSYPQCCERYISGKQPAPTAEALMRSRYAAYVLENPAYILRTWYPATRPEWEPDKRESCKWTGLTIMAHHQTGESATVEFVARYKVNGRAEKMHEISNFVFEKGGWFYVDGLFPN